jgi:hypothetical protein
MLTMEIRFENGINVRDLELLQKTIEECGGEAVFVSGNCLYCKLKLDPSNCKKCSRYWPDLYECNESKG